MLRPGVSQTKYDKLIQGLDRLALAFQEDEKDDGEDCDDERGPSRRRKARQKNELKANELISALQKLIEDGRRILNP